MLKESEYIMIRVSVPTESADKVRRALGDAGAGVQGNYKCCSASYQQVGRFLPMTGAHPAIGEVGKLEEVPEEMIETICHRDIVEEVITELKRVHPYETPAIDIVPRLEV
ncbi:MAG: hypothetical protein ABIH87_03970 [bacterium]